MSDRKWENCPLGVHAATLAKWEEVDNRFEPGQTLAKLYWVAMPKISTGEHALVSEEVKFWMPTALGKKQSKCGQRVVALHGGGKINAQLVTEVCPEIKDDGELIAMRLLSASIGKSALIEVIGKPTRAGGVFVTIGNVMPLPAGMAAPLLKERAPQPANPTAPITKAQRDKIMATARDRVHKFGGDEKMHHQLLDEVKALLGIESAATMLASQVDAFLREIEAWVPMVEGGVDEAEIPF
jgi:hypothetical protein